MRMSISCCALIVFIGCFTSVANAVPTPLFTFTGSNPASNTFGNFNIGNEFVTGQALIVSGIGARLAPSQVTAGLTTVEYNAYLYDASLTLLASQVIPVGTSIGPQGFAYVPLNYVLSPSTHYYLTSHTSLQNTTSNYSYAAANTPAGTWNLGASFVRNRYAASFGTLNSTNASYYEFMGGNLLVETLPPAPEPSTFLMLGLGAVGLSWRRKYRAKEHRSSIPREIAKS